MCCLAKGKRIYAAKLKLAFPLFVLFISIQCAAQTTSNKPPEDISNWLGLLEAVEVGGGWSATPVLGPTAYGGVKLGLPVQLTPGYPPKRLYTFTLDLGYDRMASRSGFSTEVSAMLPIFRFPGPQKDQTKNYLRIYAEPGVGYQLGGSLGGYASAKVMMVLFSDLRLTSAATKWSPYVEVQRRFPFSSPLQGDNRVAVGIMFAICKHCGLD
jgi:hypothetical protein